MTKSILITGTSSGIGKALAIKFRDEGWKVLEHRGRSDSDLCFPLNVKIASEFAKNSNVDVVVNNAAITCPGIAISEYTDHQLSNMIMVNLVAPMLLIKNLYTHLKEKNGLFVNINSMVGLEYKKSRSVYAAGKWGLRAFSESLKLDKEVDLLDVYLSNVATTPERKNALDLDFVIDNIFNSIQNRHTRLILDGRPNGGKTVWEKEF